MPDMIPVGNTGYVPPPNSGISALSGILGVRQQQIGIQQAQQNLQTGQYTQASAKANSQQDQQRSRELQSLAKFTQSAAQDPSYQDEKGQLDVNRFRKDATTVAPVYGLDSIDKAIGAAQSVITTKRASNLLNQEQNATAAGYWKSIAGNPNATDSDLAEAARRTRAIDPKNEDLARSVDAALLHIGGMKDPAAKQQAAIGYASLLSGQSPNAPGSVDNGSSIQLGGVNQYTGGMTPTGAPIQKDPHFATAVASGTSRASGVAGSDIDRSNQISQSANAAPGAIQLSKNVDMYADMIHSGHVAAGVSKAAAALGIDPISYARQLLNKDLGQLKTVASASAGSDAKMGTILSGYPDDTSATPTIHTAMDYIRGSFRQNLARGQNLQAYRTKNPDLTGFQHADDVIAQSTDPLMHEYQSLKPDERAGFYTRNFKDKAEAQAFKNRVKGAFHAIGQ